MNRVALLSAFTCIFLLVLHYEIALSETEIPCEEHNANAIMNDDFKSIKEYQEKIEKFERTKKDIEDYDIIIDQVDVLDEFFLLLLCSSSKCTMDDVKNKSDYSICRKKIAIAWLTCHQKIASLTDNDFVFSKNVSLKIAPNTSLNPSAEGLFFSGMSPNDIEDPLIRKDYENRIAENTKKIKQIYIQNRLKSLSSDFYEKSNLFFVAAYSCKPLEDMQIIKLFDKHMYPEREKEKVFEAMNIPYDNYRNWETTDGLFKAKAKFTSSDRKSVTLEKKDGNKVTIELSALRQEDRDYVKEQQNKGGKVPDTDEKTDR